MPQTPPSKAQGGCVILFLRHEQNNLQGPRESFPPPGFQVRIVSRRSKACLPAENTRLQCKRIPASRVNGPLSVARVQRGGKASDGAINV